MNPSTTVDRDDVSSQPQPGLVRKCSDSAEELDRLLQRAFEHVERQSIKLSVRDPDSGRDIAVVYDHEDLAWLLFEALYQWDMIPTLPDSIRALADEGRLDAPMRSLIQDSVDVLLDDSISDAVASSVDCHDNGPVDLRDAESQLRENSDDLLKHLSKPQHGDVRIGRGQPVLERRLGASGEPRRRDPEFNVPRGTCTGP